MISAFMVQKYKNNVELPLPFRIISSFLLFFARLFVPLTIVLGTDSRKIANKFAFSLAYSYLCTLKWK